MIDGIFSFLRHLTQMNFRSNDHYSMFIFHRPDAIYSNRIDFLRDNMIISLFLSILLLLGIENKRLIMSVFLYCLILVLAFIAALE